MNEKIQALLDQLAAEIVEVAKADRANAPIPEAITIETAAFHLLDVYNIEDEVADRLTLVIEGAKNHARPN